MQPRREGAGTQSDVVLITGSSGFIGSAVARRLARDYRVVGLDREGNPHPPPQAECVCIDVTSKDSVAAALERVRYAYGKHIAAVVHLAAYYDFSGEPSPKYDEITVRGTGNLLHGLREFEVGQFLFSSTMLVHAPCQPGERISEDWPLDPKWPYPESKVRTEELLRTEHGAVPLVVLRIAGVYDDRCHSVPLAQQMQRIFERRALSHVFPGDLSHGQAFVHLDDLVDVVARAIGRLKTLPPEITLLVGEPDTLSYGELQRAFGQLIHGEQWETQEIPKAIAKAGAWLQDLVPGEEPFIKPWMIDLADDHFALDISRARHVLDWQPRRSLGATLPAMVEALKSDPLRWYREHKLTPPNWVEPERADASTRATAPETASQADGHNRHETPTAKMAHPSRSNPREPGLMMVDHYRMFSWVQPVLVILGVWLAASPLTFRYGRTALAWNDVVTGAVIALLAALALGKWGFKAGVANCFVGMWLLFAPLAVWAPDEFTYANETLIGALVIAFSLLIPMSHEMEGPDVPPGWTYNPSSWPQRAPIIALGFIGFFLARHMAAYQLGYIDHAWDPFFGKGTERVLSSDVSKAWPVSDAGLGAMTYLIETLSGLMGDKRRWRTMPWMVAIFGFAVVPLGIVSIVLVIMQPLVVGAWCTLCLVTAAAMLLMVALSLDEVLAMLQFLARAKTEGRSVWRAFWLGGETPEDETRQPVRPISWRARPMLWGFTATWELVASTAIGVWLMFAPDAFGIGIDQPAAHSDHLVGALIIVAAVIAMAEVGRPVRFLNVALAIWLIGGSWWLTGSTTASLFNDALAGTAVLVMSLPLGKLKDHYGTLDRSVGWTSGIREEQQDAH